jgi:hypothetical protein
MDSNQVAGLLSNTGSVIAVVIGAVVIVGIMALLIVKGKLNFKSDKLSIESAKQNTKSLLAECRTSCSLMAKEFASKYIEKYPNAKYQILYIVELVLNRIDRMLQYNNITIDSDYIEMRFVDIKAIVDTNRISGGSYDDIFYQDLKESFTKMIKQLVAIKKHYRED